MTKPRIPTPAELARATELRRKHGGLGPGDGSDHPDSEPADAVEARPEQPRRPRPEPPRTKKV